MIFKRLRTAHDARYSFFSFQNGVNNYFTVFKEECRGCYRSDIYPCAKRSARYVTCATILVHRLGKPRCVIAVEKGEKKKALSTGLRLVSMTFDQRHAKNH